MEGNLLEINGNLVLKAYDDACEGKGDFKQNMQMINDGTKNYIELCKATEDEEKRQLEMELLKLDIEKRNLENKKLEMEIKRGTFNTVKDVAIEVGKFTGPILLGSLTLAGSLGMCAFKAYKLKDVISYNNRIQNAGDLGINDQKLLDISINDFKSSK